MENFTQLAKKLSLTVLLLLIGSTAFSQTQTFSSNDTFTVPPGVTSVTVQAWGAGGHGATQNATGRGGGGGGGAYAVKVIAVTPGNNIPVVVGTGSTNDSPGGDSWFLTDTTILAKGGNSSANDTGTGGSGGSGLASIGDTTRPGGNGANSGLSYSGGGGSSAGTAANGANASNQTGGNAPTGGGDGGNGRYNSNGNGVAGQIPGGGGGGGYRASGTTIRYGGNGANGQVIVTWSSPEIAVLGNGNTILTGDVSPSITDWTNFGTAAIATGTLSRTFTISNTGIGSLSVGAVSITGTGSGDFTVTSAPAATVASGASTTFTVTFDPSALGVRSATISIANNDSNENPYTFAIQGTGGDPDMSVAGNGNAIANNDTTPILTDNTDFGTTDITSGTIVKQFTISNTLASATTLDLGTITFTGTGAADFSVTTAPSATLNAGASTTFNLTFNPSATGLRSAVLSIPNNTDTKNPYTFNIQGTGADPEINVQGNSTNIADNDTTPIATDGTNMGSVNIINNTTATQTFHIYNLGSATMALSVSGVTISGTNAADFSITTLPAASVPVGGSTSFAVTFNPSATGVRTAAVNIANNDANENPYNFNIQGTGTDPEMSIQGNAIGISDGDTTPTTADWTSFGATPITGGTIVRTFTISNLGSGTAPLVLGAITVTGTHAADFAVTQPASTTLAVTGNTTFTVTFDPSAAGTRNATINIPNNDSNESPYDFAITGFGNDPEMDVAGNGLSIADGDNSPAVSDATDFGTVSIDSGSTLVTYTISNTGVGTLALGAISFSGADAANFSVATAPAATIAQGGSTTFQVSFGPTTVGAKNAVIHILNDDPTENPYNFALTGLGVRTYPDTDADGVSDNIDIDDDNDGIIDTQDQSNCAMSALSNSVEYIFLNETFGAGTTKGQININIPGATCTYCFEDGIVQPDTTDCPSQSSGILDDGEYVVVHRIANTTSGHPDNIHYDLAWNGYEDHTTGDTYGRMAVFNASYTPGIFYETTISGVMPNVPITYSFWALNIMSQTHYSGSILPNITVQFLDMSNNVLSTYNTGDIGRCDGGNSDNSCASSQWRQYTTSVNLGNTTAFVIRFRNNAPGGGGNDLAIDDINIKQQYCDRDADGIANIFDLDADNDGIPDIEEAGFASLSSGRAIMDLATPGAWADVNANGLHDSIDAMISGGTYVLPDTDGDLTRNFQDLDSDNDSLFDVDEAGLLNGDGDIDGDGLGDGDDDDGDGVLNFYDAFTGYGTQVRAFAQNTDGTGNPDYMHINSDGVGENDIQTSLYASLDANSNGVIDGSADVDRDGILDTFDSDTSVLGSPRDLDRKLYLHFDGRNDYAQAEQLLSGLPTATIMGWIKLSDDVATDSYTLEGTVMGQNNFMLRVNGSRQVVAYANGVSMTFTTALDTDRWYHIATVYDGTIATQKLKLFINGAQVMTANNASLSGALTASATPFTMGKNPSGNTLYYNGSLDEVRVFNAALTADQLQKMVYQEIRPNGSSIRGEFVPKDIELSSWPSLLAYYRMDAYKDDVIDSYTTTPVDAGASTSLARIYNVKNIRYQLAPMPFTTTLGGSIVTAVSQNNFVNGQDAIDNEWSIIHVRHDITFDQNQASLGMVIDPGTTVNLNNDNKLENSWYLKLDGKLDLEGKSQLVQTQYSDLDPTSSGFIEKDQHGTPNKFNYNYWSSPVGAINAATNNNSYTVNGVLRDGTNPANPLTLNWTSGYDSSATTPLTLSSAWIYKFQNTSNNYSNWSYVGQNGTLLAGQGFTMKGSNALTENQNYTFIGKPHNGQITMTVGPNNLNLAGNPYASALDADAFITANLGVMQGSLSFWEHFSTNNSHITAAYQGGYASYSLVGGTPAVAHPDTSELGSGSRTPQRYIPVGQGFFVKGNATGGTITFNNTQRAFVKEDNALSGAMFKQASPAPANVGINVGNADDAVVKQDTFKRIRLGYDFVNGYHRQILLGFMDEHATPSYDAGYDAEYYDSYPDEMVFQSEGRKLVIQGDGYFNLTNSYPIAIKSGTAGNVRFTLDATENFDDSQPIYIFDAQTGVYHNLRDGNFALGIPLGTIEGRFFLRFTTNGIAAEKHSLNEAMSVAYDVEQSVLGIRNEIEDATVTKVTLFNMLGQYLASFDVEDQEQYNIRIPLKNLSSGTYIVKIESTRGIITQKVILQ